MIDGPFQLRELAKREGEDALRPKDQALPVIGEQRIEKFGPDDGETEHEGGAVVKPTLTLPRSEDSPKAAPEAATVDARPPLEELKMAELHKLVPEDADIPKGLVKADLIAALREAGVE